MLCLFLSKAFCSSKRRVSIENIPDDSYFPKRANEKIQYCHSLEECDGNFIWHTCDNVLDIKGIASKYDSRGATVDGITSANQGISSSTLVGLTIKVPVRKTETDTRFVRMYNSAFDKCIATNGSLLVALCHVNQSSRTNVEKCKEYIQNVRDAPGNYVDQYCNVDTSKIYKVAEFFGAEEGNFFHTDYMIRKFNVNGKPLYATYDYDYYIYINPGIDEPSILSKLFYSTVAQLKRKY